MPQETTPCGIITAELRKETAALRKAIREIALRLEERLKALELKMVELDGARRAEMEQIEDNLQRAITAQALVHRRPGRARGGVQAR